MSLHVTVGIEVIPLYLDSVGEVLALKQLGSISSLGCRRPCAFKEYWNIQDRSDVEHA